MTPESKPSRSRFSMHLRRNFIAGLILVVPLTATILILKWLFEAIDGILGPAVENIFGHSIPGVGIVALIILVYLSGLLVANVLGRQLFHYGESILGKVPIASQIYTAFKQIIDSLMMSQQGSFKEVVLVEFPRAGMKSIAFVTSRTSDSSGKELLNLFIPTAPNPTSGFLQIVPPDQVQRTNISVEDAMKIVLSAGMVSPDKIDTYSEKQEQYE